mgnify:CR=1 FL=1
MRTGDGFAARASRLALFALLCLAPQLVRAFGERCEVPVRVRREFVLDALWPRVVPKHRGRRADFGFRRRLRGARRRFARGGPERPLRAPLVKTVRDHRDTPPAAPVTVRASDAEPLPSLSTLSVH